MKKRIHKPAPPLALASLALAVSGCSSSTTEADQPRPQPAVQTIFIDGSASTAFIASPAYADAAIKRAGDAVMQQKLGDRVRIVAFGSRSIDNAVDVLTINSGYKHRLPAVRKQVEAALSEWLARKRKSGGDGATDLMYSLEAAHIDCTPRSRVVLLTDGIAESDSYSAGRALAAGQPVHLPPPLAPYLKGCASVAVIGVGVSPQAGAGSDAEMLTNEQRQALIAGLREYLIAAGMSASSLSFTSVL